MPPAVRNVRKKDPARRQARCRCSCEARPSDHHHGQHDGCLRRYEGRRRIGLDPKILEKVIHDGLAQSWIADEWSELSFGPHSRQVFYKDLNLGLKLARELGISVPGAGLAQQLLDKIVP